MNSTGRDNQDEGFEFNGGSNIDLADNEAFRNGVGIHIADVAGITLTREHYYNNSMDFNITGSGHVMNMSTVIFDHPWGNYTNYTNLSINDTVESAYTINWSAMPPAGLPDERISFEGKFINITNRTPGVSIDNITWHWTDNESSRVSPDKLNPPYMYDEEMFGIYKYNASNWTMVGNLLSGALNMTKNTLSLGDLNPFSVFAILEYYPDEGGDDDQPKVDVDVKTPSLQLTVGCEGNVVAVKDDDAEPLAGADVTVFNYDLGTIIYTGQTNESGEYEFLGCGFEAKVHVNAKYHSPAVVKKNLINCEYCEIECITNDECEDDEVCVGLACVPVDCPCGEIEAHLCTTYECCADTDCAEGQYCDANECRWECDSDDDCGNTEHCRMEDEYGGVCEPVEGDCGYADDHAWVEFECGDYPGCAACPAGSACIDNECVEGELAGPEESFVGEPIEITALENGERCAECDVVITDPAGKNITGRTDENGQLEFPLTIEGAYKVVLLKDGIPIAVKIIEGLPKAPPPPEEPPKTIFDEMMPFCWLFIVALIVILFFYWRRRKEKEAAKKHKHRKKHKKAQE